MKKIAFFDIDGTLTSEIDGSIPESAVYAIRAARANGNLMFINTGRCFQNVEQRFRDVVLTALSAAAAQISTATVPKSFMSHRRTRP